MERLASDRWNGSFFSAGMDWIRGPVPAGRRYRAGYMVTTAAGKALVALLGCTIIGAMLLF